MNSRASLRLRLALYPAKSGAPCAVVASVVGCDTYRIWVEHPGVVAARAINMYQNRYHLNDCNAGAVTQVSVVAAYAKLILFPLTVNNPL